MQRKPWEGLEAEGASSLAGAQLALSHGSWHARFLLSIHISARSSLRGTPLSRPIEPTPGASCFLRLSRTLSELGISLLSARGEGQEHSSHTD